MHNLLTQTALFCGLEPSTIKGLLHCLQATIRQYQPGELIIQEGDQVASLGLVRTGQGRAIKEDLAGRPIIITLLQPGQEIGAILAASRGHSSPVSVQAQTEMTVLSIPFTALISRCSKACPGHDRLLRNYLGIVAEKGLVLHQRIDCLVKPTLRAKIFTYLHRLAAEQHSRAVVLPLNRAAMAEYLNVDRSALSRELSRLKKEGLLDFYKNRFQLLQPNKTGC